MPIASTEGGVQSNAAELTAVAGVCPVPVTTRKVLVVKSKQYGLSTALVTS
jgi:hypothetical protein